VDAAILRGIYLEMSNRYSWIFGLGIGIILGLILANSNVQIANPLIVIVNLMLCTAFGYVNIYFHELGHVLLGRIAGIPIKKVQIGIGRSIARFRCCGIDIEVTSSMRGGLTIPFNYGDNNIRSRFLLFATGGVLLQGFTILPFIVLGLWRPASIIDSGRLDILGAFVWSNIIGICLNLIPRQVVYYGLKIPTDGRRLLSMPFLTKRGLDELLASAIANEGACYMHSGDYEQAEQRFREALEKYPNVPLVTINLSAVLAKMGRFNETIQALEELRLTNIDRKYQALLGNNLAWAYLLKHDEDALNRAEKLSEIAFKNYPNAPAFRGTRGCTLIAKGRADEGPKILMKVVKLNKRIDDRLNPPTDYLFAAYGYWLVGERPMSEKFLLKLRQYKGVRSPDYERINEIMTAKTEGFVNAD
jgi:hypothetical protein